MPDPQRLLVLVKKDIQLYCEGLAEALTESSSFLVDVREEPATGALSNPGDSRYRLILCFDYSPLSSLMARFGSLRDAGTKLLPVVGREGELALRHLFALGCDGLVSSGSSYSELLMAIDMVAIRQLRYISPLLLGTVNDADRCARWATLSKKELDVATLIANGKRSVEIAEALSIHPKSVYTYKARMLEKLGMNNTAQLVSLWWRQGVSERQ